LAFSGTQNEDIFTPSVHLFSARANITNEEDKEEQKEEQKRT
jgi:hypothetical protein|tara:strand:+ start:398 stop:523 length:126 start_codon:yes stop_codon:yes gene_type:complete